MKCTFFRDLSGTARHVAFKLMLLSVQAFLVVPAVAQSGGREPAVTTADEFRGMWVTRFEWPDPDPAKARQTIDTVMADLAEANFNAVLFQVRGQADTLYPSPDEPWSPLIAPDGQDPGWDPLAYAIEAAHLQGLEFHAYVNTHVAWQSPDCQPPLSPEHIYYRHCNAADPKAQDWLIHDKAGDPVQFSSDDYVWLAPGVPACQAYIRRQVMYVVHHYDVDGVHFDRIRTPGPQYSHDPISRARQEPGSEGNPYDLNFADWTRNQFTRMLRDLYAQIIAAKPYVTVSCAPAGLYRKERYPSYPTSFFYGYSKAYQDAQAWLSAGAMDMVVPQLYWADGGTPPHFSELVADWVGHSEGRHLAAGQNRRWSLQQLADQVRTARAYGAAGQVMFHYTGFKEKGGFDHFAGPDGVYEQTAQTQSMRWKTNPSTGVILGYVTAFENGEPIVDAQINLPGSDDIALSSGDGLYTFLNVPEGIYALAFHKRERPSITGTEVAVKAGRVTRLDVAMHQNPGSSNQVATASPAGSKALGQAPYAPELGPDTSSPSRAKILLGITAALVLLAMILLAAIVRRKRKGRQEEKPTASPPISSDDTPSE